MTSEEILAHETTAENHLAIAIEKDRQATRSEAEALEHARASGEYLLKAKEEIDLIRPGTWEKWLADHWVPKSGKSIQTARGYMRIARRPDRKEKTITSYLKAISKDDRREKEAQDGRGWTEARARMASVLGDRLRHYMTSFLFTDLGQRLWDETVEKFLLLAEVEAERYRIPLITFADQERMKRILRMSARGSHDEGICAKVDRFYATVDGDDSAVSETEEQTTDEPDDNAARRPMLERVEERRLVRIASLETEGDLEAQALRILRNKAMDPEHTVQRRRIQTALTQQPDMTQPEIST